MKRRRNPPISKSDARALARILRAHGYRTNPGDVRFATTRIIRKKDLTDPRTKETQKLRVVKLVFPRGISIGQLLRQARR